MPDVVLSRIATCYRQWSFVEKWAGCGELFSPGTEWFVVNDDPNDPPPPALAELLDQRGVRVITPIANLGRSRARNLAAEKASGLWLDFIDGDDHPLPFDIRLIAGLEADLIAAPVRLANSQETAFADAATAPIDRGSTWDDLLPDFAPINVAPSAVLWRRVFFLGLRGYDGRFDGGEDLHLVFTAMNVGGRLARIDVPKQCYFLRGTRRTFETAHIYSHRRVLQQIIREARNPAVRQAAELWFGKEVAYETAAAIPLFWKNQRKFWKYVRFRLAAFF